MITLLSDSQIPAASAVDDTQLPCSPTELLRTDVAISTLNALDQHGKRLEEQAQGDDNSCIFETCNIALVDINLSL